MMYFRKIRTPIGILEAESDGNSITALNYLDCVPTFKEGLLFYPKKSELNEPCPDAIMALEDWLFAYFNGENAEICFPLNPKGTEFRLMIWKMLREIPYGETITYSELAEKAAAEMGKPCMSAQAVGGALGRNPIPIVIPCHRVIGKNGSLTGFAWGIDVKERLLKIEGVLK